jgi:hypothetical protein
VNSRIEMKRDELIEKLDKIEKWDKIAHIEIFSRI